MSFHRTMVQHKKSDGLGITWNSNHNCNLCNTPVLEHQTLTDWLIKNVPYSTLRGLTSFVSFLHVAQKCVLAKSRPVTIIHDLKHSSLKICDNYHISLNKVRGHKILWPLQMGHYSRGDTIFHPLFFNWGNLSWGETTSLSPLTSDYRISSYSCRGNYSFLNSSSEETIQVFISLM